MAEQQKQKREKIRDAGRIGRNMAHALEFLRRCNDYGWHSYDSTSRATRDAIARLEKLGYVETNECRQFRTPNDVNSKGE